MFKNMKKKFKNEKGLTLVELLAVVVILAIIAVIAFVLIGKVIDNSKKDSHIANAQQLIASAKLYEAQGETVDNTTGVTDTTLNEQGFIDALINPWNASDETYKGTVTKDNGVYTAKITGAGIKCDLTADGKNEKQLAEGRKEICPN